MDVIKSQCNSFTHNSHAMNVKESDEFTNNLPYMDSNLLYSDYVSVDLSLDANNYNDVSVAGKIDFLSIQPFLANNLTTSELKKSDYVDSLVNFPLKDEFASKQHSENSTILESAGNVNMLADDDEQDDMFEDEYYEISTNEDPKSLLNDTLEAGEVLDLPNETQHVNKSTDAAVSKKKTSLNPKKINKQDHRNSLWLTSFQSAPFRILLPNLWTRHLSSKGKKYVKSVAFATSTHIQVVKTHKIPNLEDQIVLISGATTNSQMTSLAEVLAWLQKSINQNLVDSEGQLALTILVPEKAVSALIGFKGLTINRIAKHCGCEIHIVLDSPPLMYKGHFDRAVIIRGNSFNFIASAVANLHEILNDLFRKHKLTEADFIYSLRNNPKSHLPRRKKDTTGSKSNQTVSDFFKSTVKGTQITSDQKRSKDPLITQDNNLSDITEEGEKSYQPSSFKNSPEQFTYLLENGYSHVFVQLILNKAHAYWIIGNSGQRKREIESKFSLGLKIYHTNVIEASERIINLRGQLLNVCRAINFMFTTYDQSSTVTTAICIPNQPVLNTSLNNLCEYVTKQMDINAWLVPSQIPSTNVSLLYLAGSAEVKVNAILLIIQQLTKLTLPNCSSNSTKKRKFSEPPQKNEILAETNFLENAVKLTLPKVVTTAQLFTINVSFKYQSEIISEGQEKKVFLELSRMLKQRIGNVQLSHRMKRESECQEINLQITGTPIGNASSILIAHEFFINLADEKAADLPSFQKPLPVRHILPSNNPENSEINLFPLSFV